MEHKAFERSQDNSTDAHWGVPSDKKHWTDAQDLSNTKNGQLHLNGTRGHRTTYYNVA